MAGFLDDMKDKMSNMSDDARARFEELKSREDRGELDDKGREELQMLREKFNL